MSAAASAAFDEEAGHHHRAQQGSAIRRAAADPTKGRPKARTPSHTEVIWQLRNSETLLDTTSRGPRLPQGRSAPSPRSRPRTVQRSAEKAPKLHDNEPRTKHGIEATVRRSGTKARRL